MKKQIKIIKENRNKYLDLLLLADPEINIVNEYIEKGDLFVLFKNNQAISLALIIPIDNNTIEIKNLATSKIHQKKGYAKYLINHIKNYYISKYNTIIIGTANSSIRNLKFYKSIGFKEFKTIKNFFIDNYKYPIFEDNIRAVDMIYLKLKIKK